MNDAKSIEWHPLMIKWCLYLRHLSGKAYETLRASGCIKLLSQRTLRDYTHCVSSTTGFSNAVDQHLMDIVDVSRYPEFKKNVVIIIDEMYIKEDLVFNKVSGELVGFSNLGDNNSHLLQFQSSLEKEDSQEQLAKTMLVFMVRGYSRLLNSHMYSYHVPRLPEICSLTHSGKLLCGWNDVVYRCLL